MATSGGSPTVIADSSSLNGPDGTTWGADGSILLAHDEHGVFRVPSMGGTPTLIIPIAVGSGARIRQPQWFEELKARVPGK